MNTKVQTSKTQTKIAGHIFNVDIDGLSSHVPRVQLALKVDLKQIDESIFNLKQDTSDNQLRERYDDVMRYIKRMYGMINQLDQHYQLVQIDRNEVIEN